MYSKKDWAKAGVLALLMLMCIVSFAFAYIHIKVNAFFTTVQTNVSGFGVLFEGIPQMFEEQAGTIAVITIIGLVASIVGLVVVCVNTVKKNEFAQKSVIAIFVIAAAVCLMQLISFCVLNGAIPPEYKATCEVSSGWFIMPIITVVLIAVYFAVEKLMSDI